MSTPEMKVKIGVAGKFRLEAFKLDENGNKYDVRKLTPWFSNLILNNGLNLMGQDSSYVSYCQIGSGTSTPVVTQSSLDNRLYSQVQTNATNYNPTTAPPYYGRRVFQFRFNPGNATGNIAEVGIGAATNGNLFSRARVVDSGGNPTTITILADEYLDVYYDLRYYFNVNDFTYDVTISGVTYSVTCRPFKIQSNQQGFSWWSYMIGSQVQLTTQNNSQFLYPNAYYGASELSAVTGDGPTGTSLSGNGSTSNNAYVNGSYTRTASIVFGLDQANHATGIGALQFLMFGAWQMKITPPIMKTNLMVLTLNVSISWDRYAP